MLFSWGGYFCYVLGYTWDERVGLSQHVFFFPDYVLCTYLMAIDFEAIMAFGKRVCAIAGLGVDKRFILNFGLDDKRPG
jgi:hypothetical protein